MKPELLSPAGTLKNMRYALAYGADAVYAGLPRYSLRVRNNDFDRENLRVGIAEAHAQGRRFYLACNLMPHGSKLKTFLADMEPVIEMGPDALIMADPGLIMLVRERWPDMPIHLSVQANTVNAASVRFWQRQGITRVILSRELSLDEIADIRASCPDIELEVFVHGALCIAYSGRCLLSGYLNHRDANQGACTNACRWEYKVGVPDSSSMGQGRHADADEVYLLEESKRPGEYMPVFEDENGTYIMNAKDLRAVEHVGRLVRLGDRLPQDRGPHQVPLLRCPHHSGLSPGHRGCTRRKSLPTGTAHRPGRARQPGLYGGLLPPPCPGPAAELRAGQLGKPAADLRRGGSRERRRVGADRGQEPIRSGRRAGTADPARKSALPAGADAGLGGRPDGRGTRGRLPGLHSRLA